MFDLTSEDYCTIKDVILPFVERHLIKFYKTSSFGLKLINRTSNYLVALALTSNYDLVIFEFYFLQEDTTENQSVQSRVRLKKVTEMQNFKRNNIEILGLSLGEYKESAMEFYVKSKDFKQREKEKKDAEIREMAEKILATRVRVPRKKQDKSSL